MFGNGEAKVVAVYLETGYNFYQFMEQLSYKCGSSMLMFDPEDPDPGQSEEQYVRSLCDSVTSFMPDGCTVAVDLVRNHLNFRYSVALVAGIVEAFSSKGATVVFVTLDPLVVDAVESYSEKHNVAVICYDCESDTFRNVTSDTDKWVYKPVLDVVQKFEDAKNK